MNLVTCFDCTLSSALFFAILSSEEEKNTEPAELDKQQLNATILFSQNTQCKQRMLSIGYFVHDPEGIHHYTEMESYSKLFMWLFYCLGPLAFTRTYFHGTIPA